MEEDRSERLNLNISRYISTAVAEEKIDLKEVNKVLVVLVKKIEAVRDKYDAFLKELGCGPCRGGSPNKDSYSSRESEWPKRTLFVSPVN